MPEASDFEKTFKLYARRHNVEWAKINRRVKPRRRSQGRDEEVTTELEQASETAAVDIDGWEARGEFHFQTPEHA